MNKSIFRVCLCLVLLLSLSLTSVFASSYFVPYSEPPAGSDNGYVSLGFSNGNILTYWWSCSASTSGTQQISSYCDISISGSTISFTLGAYPPSSGTSFMYNISRRTGGNLWLMGSGSSTSASGVSFSHNFSAFGTLVDVYYAGNVNAVSLPSGLGSASMIFETSTHLGDVYSKVNDIYNSLVNLNTNNYDNLRDVVDSVNDLNANVSNLTINNQKWLGYIFDRLELTNVRLGSILDILEDFADTSLSEPTNPLPDQGLTDYESQQGELKNESDVSSSLDNIFEDADFGSFSNGFNAIWGLFDRILSVNPILNLVLALVLTLGLVNLIFNRR